MEKGGFDGALGLKESLVMRRPIRPRGWTGPGDRPLPLEGPLPKCPPRLEVSAKAESRA